MSGDLLGIPLADRHCLPARRCRPARRPAPGHRAHHPGCVIAPGSSEEHTDQVHALATVYAPLDVDVTATDRLILPDGTRWQVHGFPARTAVRSRPEGVCVISIESVTG